jgi:hypothetical protein
MVLKYPNHDAHGRSKRVFCAILCTVLSDIGGQNKENHLTTYTQQVALELTVLFILVTEEELELWRTGPRHKEFGISFGRTLSSKTSFPQLIFNICIDIVDTGKNC